MLLFKKQTILKYKEWNTVALKKNSENDEPPFSYQSLLAGVGVGGAHITDRGDGPRCLAVALLPQERHTPRTWPHKTREPEKKTRDVN